MISETSNECATSETGCHVGTNLTVLKFEMCFPMECIHANKKLKKRLVKPILTAVYTAQNI